MTKYYFLETDTGNAVIVTNGKKCYLCPHKNGIDVNSNVDLYSKSVISDLKSKYEKMRINNTLYCFDDVVRDFSDKIFDISEIDSCINHALIIKF